MRASYRTLAAITARLGMHRTIAQGDPQPATVSCTNRIFSIAGVDSTKG
jgi:hypothetical protein